MRTRRSHQVDTEPARIVIPRRRTNLLGSNRGYSPASTCYGLMCPRCGRTWQSVTGPIYRCEDCGWTRKDAEKIRNRAQKRKAYLRQKELELSPTPTSDVTSSLHILAAEQTALSSRRTTAA